MNIVLSGFMGSGKSTVARLLAGMSGRAYVDLDSHIEQEQGMNVNDIFLSLGEERFRELEKEAVKTLSERDGIILATGGGTILDGDNVSALKKNGTIIFLDVTVETIMDRLVGDTTRPLLMRVDKENAVSELLRGRLPVYTAAADIIVDANDGSEKAAKEIFKKLLKEKQ